MLPSLTNLVLADVSMNKNQASISSSGPPTRQPQDDGMGQVRRAAPQVTPAETRQGARDKAAREARRQRILHSMFGDLTPDELEEQRQYQAEQRKDFEGTDPPVPYDRPQPSGSRNVRSELDDELSPVHGILDAYKRFNRFLEQADEKWPESWYTYINYTIDGVCDTLRNNFYYTRELSNLTSRVAHLLRQWHTRASAPGTSHMPTALLYILSMPNFVMEAWKKNNNCPDNPKSWMMKGSLEAMLAPDVGLEYGLLPMIAHSVSVSNNNAIRDIESDLEGVLEDISNAMWEQFRAAKGGKRKQVGESGGGRVQLPQFYADLDTLISELEDVASDAVRLFHSTSQARNQARAEQQQ